jgi:hypothetical protein
MSGISVISSGGVLNRRLPEFIGGTGKIPSPNIEFITPLNQRYPQIERITNNGEIMLYGFGKNEHILPSEIERKLEVYITREEIDNSFTGRNLSEIASPEVIASAKSDVIMAIDQIARSENIQITDEDKEKLANFSITLMKRIAAEV